MTMQKPRTKPRSKSKPKSEGNFWRELAKIGEAIPASERVGKPTDISKNVDHYLYGSPKEN